MFPPKLTEMGVNGRSTLVLPFVVDTLWHAVASPASLNLAHTLALHHSVDQQYRFLYFNEMNLAVKSPLLSRRIAISPDAMRLLTEVNTEYDRCAFTGAATIA